MPTINKKNKIQTLSTKWKRLDDDAKYYNSTSWHNLRNYYIKHHPFCEICEENGRVRLGEEVHHKTEFLSGNTEEERWQLLLDEDNLQTLCKECHHNIHSQKKKSTLSPHKK